MEILTLSKAKPTIGRLIDRALKGESVVIRKGNKLVRIMYTMCPCGVEEIKPLAKKLADRL